MATEFKQSATALNLKIAAELKTLRHNNAHTMRSLSALIGAPHSFIGKIEHQNRRIDIG